MRLAISCAGEGRGHISRVIALSQIMKERHDILYWCPDSVKPMLLEYIPDACILPLKYLHFAKKGYEIDYFTTMKENAPLFLTMDNYVRQLSKDLKSYQIQGVISDFEPFLSRAALKAGIPLVNLNHPSVVLRAFSLSPEAVTAKVVARLLVPLGGKDMICSFYHGDTGPIIRRELREITPETGRYFLVYVKESARREMEEALSAFPGHEYRIYPRKNNRNFTTDLAGCCGVIAPSGHQLMSESLSMGKTLLVFPQKGQYEQVLNARMLEKSGRGMQGNPDDIKGSLRRFFENRAGLAGAVPGKEFKIDDSTVSTVENLEKFFREELRPQPGYLTGFSLFRRLISSIAS